MGGVNKQAMQGLGRRGASVINVDPTNLVIPGYHNKATFKDNVLVEEMSRLKVPLSRDEIEFCKRRDIRQPIEVRRNGDEYELVDGRRRVLIAIAANEEIAKAGGGENDLITVPCLVVKGDDDTLLGDMIALNTHRVDYTPAECARISARLLERNKPLKEIAQLFKVTEQTIKDWVATLDLHPTVQKAIDEKRISMSAVRPLVALKREEQVTELEKILAAVPEGKRATVEQVRRHTKAKANKKPPTETSNRIPARLLARMVKIATTDKAEGKLKIDDLVFDVLRVVNGDVELRKVSGLTELFNRAEFGED